MMIAFRADVRRRFSTFSASGRRPAWLGVKPPSTRRHASASHLKRISSYATQITFTIGVIYYIALNTLDYCLRCADLTHTAIRL